MPIKLQNKGQDFDPIPAGVHQAVCYGVVDIGTQKSNNPAHRDARKLVLLFELPFERGDFGERKNAPRGTSITLTQSLNERAVLRKMLKSWRGRDFTQEELDGFDPKVLIGVNCQLNMTHTQKGDKTYCNIETIMPLSKGQAKQAQENKSLYFSLEDIDLTNLKLPENMPQWIQEKIHFCKEVMEANGAGDQFSTGSSGHASAAHEDAARQADAASGRPAPTPPPQENIDEDVPF